MAPSIANALADLRYGFRQLRLNPGFAAVAILTLALGIGANTALFTVVRGIILKPLPYPEPERIVRVWMDNRILQMREDWTSWLNYQDYKRLSTSFESFAAFTQPMMNVIGDGEPERIRGVFTEAALFRVLGAQQAEGRLFTQEEEADGPAARGGDRLGAVAAPLRRRAGARQDARFRRPALHRDRRHEARLRVSDEGYRVLGAALRPSESAKSRGGYWLQMAARLEAGRSRPSRPRTKWTSSASRSNRRIRTRRPASASTSIRWSCTWRARSGRRCSCCSARSGSCC